MSEELEQLLEAEWAGPLSDAQRRRLEELCAADPAAAELVRQERKLSVALAQYGPNHAPQGLLEAVMGRLEAESRVEKQLLPRINLSSALRFDLFRRMRPMEHWLPYLRWGSALALFALIVMQAGYLMRQEVDSRKSLRQSLISESSALPGNDEANTPQMQARLLQREAKRKQQAGPTRSRNTFSPQVKTYSQDNLVPGVDLAQIIDSEATDFVEPGAPPPAPAIVATPLPEADPQPMLADAQPAAPPQEERVSIQVAVAQSPEAEQPRRTLGLFGNDRRTRGGFPASSFLERDLKVGPSSETPTARDIEVIVAEAGGNILTREPVEGRPGSWRLTVSLGEQEMRQFMAALEQIGVNAQPPAPAVRGIKPNERVPAQPRPLLANRYHVSEGEAVVSSLEATGETTEPAQTAAPRRILLELVIEQVAPAPAPAQ